MRQFAATARGELADVPGLSISGGSFTAMASGGTSVLGKPIQITLQTIGDADALNQFSLELEEKLKTVPGLVDVDVSYQPGKPEVLLVVDRRKAADMGINIATVGSTIRTLVEGAEVGDLPRRGRRGRHPGAAPGSGPGQARPDPGPAGADAPAASSPCARSRTWRKPAARRRSTASTGSPP